MKIDNKNILIILISIFGTCIWNVLPQMVNLGSEQLSHSINDFTFKLLEQENTQNLRKNFAISPYTVWCVLNMIAAGAEGDTVQELKEVLNIEKLFDNRDSFWNSYRTLVSALTKNSPGINLDITNAIFIDNNLQLNPRYERLMNELKSPVMKVNFDSIPVALNTVNKFIETETKNRIPHFATSDELRNVKLLITSILYFKGLWKMPFDRNATRQQAFTDENGNKIGNVQLMHQVGPFPFTRLQFLNAHAIELPYGLEDQTKMSMIIILPKLGINLDQMLKNLTRLKIDHVFEALKLAEEIAGDEDVKLYIPRFSITSDFTLEGVLFDMGLMEVFNDNAELNGITSEQIRLSHVIHRANIDVNEEGTIASAATGGSFQYKSPPPTFQANRPFAYFIVDKITNVVLFCGKFIQPNQ